MDLKPFERTKTAGNFSKKFLKTNLEIQMNFWVKSLNDLTPEIFKNCKKI